MLSQNPHSALPSDEMLLLFVSQIFFFCVAHLRFQISRCPGQRLAFLPRRPAILVLSVLLTATLMCVTLFFSPSLPPPSSIFSASSLHSCSSAFSSVDDDGDEGLGVKWIHVIPQSRALYVIFFSKPPRSEWIKNSSCCSGRAVLPGSTAKGRC